MLKSFGPERNIFGFTCNRGANLAKCHTLLGDTVKNKGFFVRPKPIFQINCLEHVLVGACKSGVLTVVTENGDLNTKTNTSENATMHYMDKKSKKGAVSLATSQEKFNFPKLRLLTTASTKFAYLIHSFCSLLINK